MLYRNPLTRHLKRRDDNHQFGLMPNLLSRSFGVGMTLIIVQRNLLPKRRMEAWERQHGYTFGDDRDIKWKRRLHTKRYRCFGCWLPRYFKST